MNELPTGILIDLDDTILDDSSTVEGCWADACVEAGVRIPGVDVEALRIEVRKRGTAWWNDAIRHQRGRLDLRAASVEIVREVFQQMGYDVARASGVANYYRDLREERAQLFPEAIETLELLRSRGVRLGMMTNGGSQSQRQKIEKFGLERLFEHIVIEGELGVGKLHPRVFATLLEALRLAPEETWAVGDNIEADVYGAMDAGIHGIWIDASGGGLSAGETRRPDRIVKSIRELVTEDALRAI